MTVKLVQIWIELSEILTDNILLLQFTFFSNQFIHPSSSVSHFLFLKKISEFSDWCQGLESPTRRWLQSRCRFGKRAWQRQHSFTNYFAHDGRSFWFTRTKSMATQTNSGRTPNPYQSHVWRHCQSKNRWLLCSNDVTGENWVLHRFSQTKPLARWVSVVY